MDEKSRLISGILRYLWLILIPGLAACIPTGNPDSASKWLPSQVRALDPAESAQNPFAPIDPSQDLIALYSRETASQLQIRLDLLNLKLNSASGLPLNPTSDIYIAVDFLAGDPSRTWDFLISIPAEGKPIAEFLQQPENLITPSVQFDALLDCLIISIDKAALPDIRPGYTLRAILTAPNSGQILDEIPPTRSTATVEPLPLALAFWNALPAHTPAQALRRWDGAHTGPLGERHGLKHLLEASKENQVPVVLLDLKTPSTLAALDLLGQTQYIASLQRDGLLILPESLPETYFGDLPAWTNQHAAQTSRRTALNFGLAGSSFLFAPGDPIDTIRGYNLIFVPQPAPDTLSCVATRTILLQGQRFIPLPQNDPEVQQATDQGLALETRRALLHAALDEHHIGRLTVLGGDLSRSTFGNPQASQAALRYIAGHPWIKVLTPEELQTFPSCPDCVLPDQETETIEFPVLTALQKAPPSPISELAWQMFLDLSAPATPAISELAGLRASYLGEIGNLLAAANWESRRETASSILAIRNPAVINCKLDTDLDGQTECILANADYFALVDPDGGRLALLFAGSTQLVGASSQFVVGLSDHLEWDLEAGPLADPANIPGALAGPWSSYEIEPLPDGVRLTTAGVEKIFRLSENGLRVDVSSAQPLPYQIPLAVAPESRLVAKWAGKYQEAEIPQGWVWGIINGPKVEIRVSDNLTSHNFLESKASLSLPENPNLSYPSGHFIPFPLAVFDLSPKNNFWVEISLSSNQPPDQ